MPKFGIAAVPTHESIQPGELAGWTESNGFESLWFGEHSHIPTSRLSPSPIGGEVPDFFKQFYDQFIALAVAASVTTKLRVGTGVCLVPEHHTINLAKAVACLDRVSDGRMLFGIGAGWNAEEMADHGVAFKDRWKVTREKVLAMRAIWTRDVAEYRGQFVNFAPLWCWPKPLQAGGPPVLLGAYSKWVPKRVAEYCDGWFPIDFPGIDLAGQLEGIKVEMERVGRPFKELDLSIQVIAGAPAEKAIPRIAELVKLGFERIVFLVPQTQPSVQWPALEGVARLIREFS